METAAERFDLQIVPTPGWKRPILAVAAFAVGFGASDSLSTGGRRARVIERATGTVVHTEAEPWLTNGATSFDALVSDHADSSAEAFAARWLD